MKVVFKFTKYNDCDVVLVTKDQVIYSGLQNFRMQKEDQKKKNKYFYFLDKNLKNHAVELSQTALRGELALFLGAGVSMG